MASAGIIGLSADEVRLDDSSHRAGLFRIELGASVYIEVGFGDREADAAAMDRLAEVAAQIATHLRSRTAGER